MPPPAQGAAGPHHIRQHLHRPRDVFFASERVARANPAIQPMHALACDSDPMSQRFVVQNFPRAAFFNCVLAERFSTDAPIVDVCCAGFACQPFSIRGRQRGLSDGRSSVIGAILRYVASRQPKLVILENVMGLLHLFPRVCWGICERLRQQGYEVNLRILDSWRYGAVPQSRTRLYILAVRRDVLGGRDAAAAWRSLREIPPPRLRDILDPPLTGEGPRPPRPAQGRLRAGSRFGSSELPKSAFSKVRVARSTLRAFGIDMGACDAVVDCDGILGEVSVGRIPCVTRSRARSGGFWLLERGRMMGVPELLRAQGFDDARVFERGALSPEEVAPMVGNAFTESVIARLLCKGLPLAGLSGALVDPYDP